MDDNFLGSFDVVNEGAQDKKESFSHVFTEESVQNYKAKITSPCWFFNTEEKSDDSLGIKLDRYRSEYFYLQGEFEASIKYCDNVIKILEDTDSNTLKPRREILELKARSLLNLDHKQEALKCVDNALSMFRSDALEGRFSLFLLKSKILLQLNQPVDAIPFIIKAITVHRTTPTGWSLLHKAYILANCHLLSQMTGILSNSMFPQTLLDETSVEDNNGSYDTSKVIEFIEQIKKEGIENIAPTKSKEEQSFIRKFMLSRRNLELPEETREERKKFDATIL